MTSKFVNLACETQLSEALPLTGLKLEVPSQADDWGVAQPATGRLAVRPACRLAYLIRPSAFMAATTAGRAAMRARTATMFG